MVNIKEFHREVFSFLNDLRSQNVHDPNITYSYRKSNFGGRLETGYWFYGNDDYFCISFWSGMDWKNRTPNIGWFLMANGDCQLEINISDSYEKEKFVEEQLIGFIDGLHREGRKYVKRYGYEENARLDFLDLFIHGHQVNYEISDKSKIDFAVNKFSIQYFNEKDENKIGFISEEEFRKREKKIIEYKKIFDADNDEVHFQSERSNRLKTIEISNYYDIDNIRITDIPKSAQWLFVTGENGSGKTSFLKALTTILGYRTLDKDEISKNPNFAGSIEFHASNKSNLPKVFHRNGNENCHHRFPMTTGLVVLGPNRLISYQDSVKKSGSIELELKKERRFSALWDFEYRMLDIEKQLDIWFKEQNQKFNLDERMYFVKSALIQTVPGLHDVRFSKEYESGRKRTNLKTTFYLQSDKELEKGWRELPSGTRSIFALVGEIIIRLSSFQKTIIDPAEFKGIVLIDEIDLHLHPKAQREFIQNMSETFRQVQFIVTTHSPIPLLGFDGQGVIIRVSRSSNNKVIAERLMEIEKDISLLTPNQLLSSNLFGRSKIVSDQLKPDAQIITAKDMEDYDFNLKVVEKLSTGLSDEQRHQLSILLKNNERE
jgi:predicted ATP-binding protein involved in virulence